MKKLGARVEENVKEIKRKRLEELKLELLAFEMTGEDCEKGIVESLEKIEVYKRRLERYKEQLKYVVVERENLLKKIRSLQEELS